MAESAQGTGAVLPDGGRREIAFAMGIIAILLVLFLPIPAIILDLGLALSISFSVLILLVALWIPRRSISRPSPLFF